MGRVPIGTTNFSELPYTYMDHSTNVENEFMLAEYDFKYKVLVYLVYSFLFISMDDFFSNSNR